MASIKVRPDRVAPKDMTERQWSRFCSQQEAEFYRSGQIGFDDGVGFFLGDDEGVPKFSIGDSDGAKLTWDGVTLEVVGTLSAITGAFSGPVTIGPGGSLSSGQTAYNTGVGFWFEYNAGNPRFSIGNSAGPRMTWDGSELDIFGVDGVERTIDNLVLKGDSDTNAPLGALLGSAIATSNPGVVSEWQPLRTVVTNFTGSFRLMVEARRLDTIGAPPLDGSWRLKNGAGTVVHTETFSSTSYADTFSDEEVVTLAGDVWTIEGLTASDLMTYALDTQIRNIEVRARFDHATIT
jgi:hypothetical protein